MSKLIPRVLKPVSQTFGLAPDKAFRGKGLEPGPFITPLALSLDITRVGAPIFNIQGIKAPDVMIYLKALITQKMGALGSPEG